MPKEQILTEKRYFRVTITMIVPYRLHTSDVDLRWLLAMSPRFLVGRLKSDKRRIHVWDRENGYVKLPMEDAPRLISNDFYRVVTYDMERN